MATVVLSPIGGAGDQFFNNNGAVLSGGKLYTYAAGTTTPQVTYNSNTGTVPNANPVVLDSSGRVPVEVWLIYQTSYKIVLKDAAGVTIFTWDNVSNDQVFPATLPISNGQNLTGLNASQLTFGTVPALRLPDTYIPTSQRGAPSGVATLDGAGGLAQTPGANSVATSALQANAVTVSYGSVSVTGTIVATGTLADITGASITFTPTGGQCLLVVNVPSLSVNGNSTYTIKTNLDGTDGPVIAYAASVGATLTSGNGSNIVNLGVLSATSHTIKLRHIGTGSFGQLNGANAPLTMYILELKR